MRLRLGVLIVLLGACGTPNTGDGGVTGGGATGGGATGGGATGGGATGGGTTGGGATGGGATGGGVTGGGVTGGGVTGGGATGGGATGGGATGGGATGGGATGGGTTGGGATGGGATGGGSPIGTEYFVAQTGLDSNPGTSTLPFRTIQKGVNVASAAASTVTVRAGTYTEKVTISSGTTALWLRSAPGELAIIDGTGLTVANGQQGLITIDSHSNTRIEGFELRNFRSTNGSVPLGLYAFGSGTQLEFINNHVHHIITTVGSCSGAGGNAFGLAVYGSNAPTPWMNVRIIGNELDHLTLGCSESLSVNGNVDGFEVSDNLVHDNDNIGIVAIGFEGTCPTAALDQARNGVIRHNTVTNINSINNPAYGGESAADGIYVDGGKNILIERNVVHHADLGIELASEHAGRSSSYVLARNNVIEGSVQAGLSVGGYDNTVGNADHDVLLNNTLSSNTVEVQLQFHITELRIQNVISFSPSSSFVTGSLSGVTQTTNLQRSGAASATFVNAPTDLHTVAALDAQVVDHGTAFTCPAGWTCPAVWGTPLEGAADVTGNTRVNGTAIDLGAFER